MCTNLDQLSYPEQLETQEWKSRRDVILERDHYCCSMCGKGESERICFDNTYYVGIDKSIPMILPSNSKILESGISLIDFIKEWNSTRIKIGKIRHSNHIGLLTAEGRYLYSVWTDAKYKDLDMRKDAQIATLLCDDGYMAYVVYIHEDDLEKLELPRVYVQKTPIVLNVHHKRYIIGKKAWEYDDSDLVTLCEHCHSKVHEFIPVQTYVEVDGRLSVMNYTPCLRCNGTGYFHEYRNIQNGICFRCHGVRFEELIRDNYIEINL